MKGQSSGKCTALCMLAWTYLHCAWSVAVNSMATFAGTGFQRDFSNRTDAHGNLSAQCMALLPPLYGSYYIETGTGLALGSVIVYWCRDGYQLVGSRKLACLLQDSASHWSHPAPHCEVIPKPLDKGFQVAVIASLISGAIILTMSISFATCCLRDRMLRTRAQQLEIRKEQQHSRMFQSGRQVDPINRETEKQQGVWGKLKHYHRLDYRISALRSSVYPGALAGCSNQGFQRYCSSQYPIGTAHARKLHPPMLVGRQQRSQENSDKPSMQSLRSEIHIFPQGVLQPGTPPSASMYIHLPQKTGDISLAIMPCHANSPRDVPTAYFKGYEEHKPLKPALSETSFAV